MAIVEPTIKNEISNGNIVLDLAGVCSNQPVGHHLSNIYHVRFKRTYHNGISLLHLWNYPSAYLVCRHPRPSCRGPLFRWIYWTLFVVVEQYCLTETKYRFRLIGDYY